MTVTASLFIHVVVAAFVLLFPLLSEETLPEPDQTGRAFFVTLVAAPPPLPPPPPPAAGTRSRARVSAKPPRPESPKFVAPTAVPDRIRPEVSDLGVDGGVPGGVEGGVPGGVMGGIVGGLMEPKLATPTPSLPTVVRVGGQIRAPTLVQRVPPVYPPLARNARLSGLVVLEAQVGVDGRVQSVKVLSGPPILRDAALEAVRQWRYQPLLLNGVPTEFVLTVTVTFQLMAGTR